MMRIPRLLLIAIYFLFFTNAWAQDVLFVRDSSIKVYAYGQEQTLAWCGGMNNPQFSMADLNQDGLQDLIVFEPWGNLATFINTGTPGNPVYTFMPEFALNFPPVYDYLVMADYNCDSIPDLFHQGATGISVYTGYYNSAHQLCFTYFKDLYYYDATAGYVNVFNNPGDIPAIVDVDGDGDLDFVTYSLSGGSLYWYKNMRVELGLPCDSIRLELADRCWGKFGESFYHPVLQTCGGASPDGHTPCLFDYDMDGDYDLLRGSLFYNQLSFLQNGRIPYNPSGVDSMVTLDTAWQSGGMVVNLPTWPAAFNVDIDQDGKKDLLISPNDGGNLSENFKTVWYYKNLSTTGSPNWVFQSDSFLSDKMIDIGTAAYPMLFDYNKDGKPDLFIGSDGYFKGQDTLVSRISYYQNTSTPGNPSFTLQTNDFMGMGTQNFHGAAPAAGDIDNDGIADLVIGHTDGTLSYYKNIAASDAVQPIWQLAEQVLKDANGDTIYTGGYAAPFIYDVDKDGMNDLVIGSISGYLQYYKNISTTPGTISLRLSNMQLGGAQADPVMTYGNFSVPFIGRTDSTSTDYLLMGSNSGNIYRFSGIGSGDTALIYTMVDSQFSYIDSFNNGYNHELTATFLNERSAVTVGDVAGDGTLYLIAGDKRGGVELYKWGTSSLKTPLVSKTEKVLVYPNPATDKLNISWNNISAAEVQVSVINMEGQQLYAASVPSSANHAVIPVSALAEGVYVCVLQSGVSRYYNKFTVIR